MVAGAAWIADALLVLFVWAILALAFWRVFQRTGEKATWLNWLGRSVTIGAIGCVIGSLAFAGSMVEQYVVGEEGDPHALTSRWFGPYAWSYWAKPLSFMLAAIVLFSKRSRRSWWIAWAMAFLLTDPFDLFERLVMVITSLHRDYLPTSWTLYHTWLDLLTPISLLFCALLMWRTERRETSRLS